MPTRPASIPPAVPVEKKFAVFSTKLYFQATFFPISVLNCLSVSIQVEACMESGEIDQLKGVYPGSFNGQAPMEMRTCDSSCGAHLPQHRARFQGIAHFHINLGQMPVQRIDT